MHHAIVLVDIGASGKLEAEVIAGDFESGESASNEEPVIKTAKPIRDQFLTNCYLIAITDQKVEKAKTAITADVIKCVLPDQGSKSPEIIS